jgi:hypothetical protein
MTRAERNVSKYDGGTMIFEAYVFLNVAGWLAVLAIGWWKNR